MPATIVATKLAIPKPRANRVERTRLKRALSAGIHRKLTLVCAPAGFGKSTLVAEWLADWKGNIAWISLDSGDGELSSFLAYLVAALSQITRRGDELLEIARSPQSSPESILATLIGDLVAIKEQVILVLDDYHLVDSAPVDAALQFLVDHLPQSTHLIITTREDPQIALGRLRAKDELSELRVSDLRFDSEEARAFLNQVMKLELSAESVASLEERTEGWIAGLQLAALSLRGASDRERFVSEFSGSHRFILDYLAEDVLARLPEQIRTFLEETSILDRFTAELCGAVTRRSDSEAVIDYLDRANLFVIQLDAERRWYRYHHLFLDLLRSRLAARHVETAELHSRASDWFAAADLPLEAFAHAVAAQDTDRATTILEGDGLPLHYRGTFAPVERWLTSLSPEVLDQRPELRVACAWVLTTRGAPVTEVDALLDAAEVSVRAMQPGARRDDLLGQIAAIRALLGVPKGELVPIIEHAQIALELLDPRNGPVKTAVAWSLGYAQQQLGELEAARSAFEQSINEGRASGNRVITIGATISLGQVYERTNQLSQATRSYGEAIRLAGDPPLPYACEAYLGLARVEYERDEMGAARENAERARDLGRNLKNVDTPGMAALLEARIELARGDLHAARSSVEDAAEIFAERGIEYHGGELADVEAQILIGEGEHAAAMKVARAHDLTDRIAQLHLLAGDPVDALETLGTYVGCNEREAIAANLTSQIIAAAAFWMSGEQENAVEKLAVILEAAEKEKIIRSFVDLGAPVRALLTDSPTRTRFPGYMTSILDAFGGQHRCAQPAEPLSRRELEVLKLIAEGLSNAQIGERLFIALDTVKGHTRKIYEKLEVNRRTEAVAKAVEIGLL